MFAADLVDNEDSPAFVAGFLDDGKLGYGFTSADDLEEVDIGPGISHGRHLSAVSWIRFCERR